MPPKTTPKKKAAKAAKKAAVKSAAKPAVQDARGPGRPQKELPATIYIRCKQEQHSNASKHAKALGFATAQDGNVCALEFGYRAMLHLKKHNPEWKAPEKGKRFAPWALLLGSEKQAPASPKPEPAPKPAKVVKLPEPVIIPNKNPKPAKKPAKKPATPKPENEKASEPKPEAEAPAPAAEAQAPASNEAPAQA